ncbi:MAG: RidA family protein [Nitrospinaceae bacterium]|nr:RidA family protein [Nitrospinaceae bacterium]
MAREYFKGTWHEDRSFSQAVATRGGRTVWLAGVGMGRDKDGNLLAGDFEAQVRASFAQIEETLGRTGGKLADIVTMTVFILDVRHGNEFVELRKEYFSDGFPGSALITVAGFAKPEMMVEIQAIAVVGDE